jgi:hypothetical protein
MDTAPVSVRRSSIAEALAATAAMNVNQADKMVRSVSQGNKLTQNKPVPETKSTKENEALGSNANNLITASNGVPAAPTRASPAPMQNGRVGSPPVEGKQEMPQSVASTDPKVAAQQATDMRNIVRRKLTGYVGFANLPNQWHRKSVRKGFNFNVMVVGMFTTRN